jgi:hypothetical protein
MGFVSCWCRVCLTLVQVHARAWIVFFKVFLNVRCSSASPPSVLANQPQQICTKFTGPRPWDEQPPLRRPFPTKVWQQQSFRIPGSPVPSVQSPGFWFNNQFSWWFVCLGRKTTPLNFCRFGRINPQMKHPPKISPHNPPHPPYVVGRATRRPGETFKDAICTWSSNQTKNSKRSGKKIECSCVSR